LENYLIANGFNYDDTTVGNKIAKSLSTASGWDVSSISGAVGNSDYPLKRNVTGFSTYPAGWREYGNGLFEQLEALGYFWTSTASISSTAQSRRISWSSVSTIRDRYNYKYGFSIRCIRPVSFYGALYNWYAATDARNIAPTGCHVPSHAEWSELIYTVCGGNSYGEKLMEDGLLNWNMATGTNSLKFNAIGGGARDYYNQIYYFLHEQSLWWGITTSGGYPYTYVLDGYGSTIVAGTQDHRMGNAIRCICDTSAETITDIDGNIYDVVQIGTQRWLVQDLKTTKYRDGTTIPNITNHTTWAGLTTGAMCYYNNAVAPPTANQPLTVDDASGNTYDVIQIGRQLWMQQNLKTLKYNDGTDIPKGGSDPNFFTNAEWAVLSTPGVCSYLNDDSYV